MNIFYLDNDIKLNAMYHCDRHVVKMITEQAQLLCSAYYYTNSIPHNIYKLTHSKHPCSVWARESLSNWKWLKEMTLELYNEYIYRYGKKHKAGELVKTLIEPQLQDIGITKRPQAMPDEYKHEDPVVAYRNYYLGQKHHLFQYKNRKLPPWINIEN